MCRVFGRIFIDDKMSSVEEEKNGRNGGVEGEGRGRGGGEE